MRRYPPSIVFGFSAPGTRTADDRFESLTEAIREVALPRGTVGASEAVYPGVGSKVRVQPRALPTQKASEGESKLELARQQWRAGLRGRVQAVETLMSGPERIEVPTPKMDGDD